MSKGLIFALVGGLVSGMLYGAVLTGSFGGLLLAYLSLVPLFMVGFGLGTWPLAVAGAVAAGAVAGLAGFAAAVLLIATNIGPLCWITYKALMNRPDQAGVVHWYPTGYLIAWLAVIAAVALAVLGIFQMGHPGGTEGAVRAVVGDHLTMALSQAGADPLEIEQLTAWLSHILPGMAAMSWMLMMAINAILAQGLLVGLNRNIRPKPSLAELHLPRWLLGAFGVVVLMGIAVDGSVGYIGRNLAMVFAVPFFFQGLALIHTLLGRFPARRVALIIFYVVLIFLGGSVFQWWPLALIVAIGVVESLANFRAKLPPPRDDEEQV